MNGFIRKLNRGRLKMQGHVTISMPMSNKNNDMII